MTTIDIPKGMNTELFVLERGALKYLPQALAEYFFGRAPYLVADENTWAAAGKTVQAILERNGIELAAKPVIFPGKPRLHPHESISQKLAADFPKGCVPVAIGSGVINDLVKRASGIAGITYCCVPTASSVDGYSASGAAMSVDGRKVTMPCPSPRAIVADTDVLETAPPEMLAAGYADLFTKIPAGADWMIADSLGIEAIDPFVWNLVQGNLRDWLRTPIDMNSVFHGLAATGFAIQVYKESRPASGAEHLFSHVWEMESLMCNGDTVSHGFQVAIGTIIAVQFMEFVMNHTAEQAKALAEKPVTCVQRQAEIAELLKRGCYGTGIETTAMEKFLEGETLMARRTLIWSKWAEIQGRIAKQLPSLDEIIDIFKKCHVPTDYHEIGLEREQYLHAIRVAQLMRKRYTVLDLLYEAGLLNAAIEELK